jgi:1-aminocyclopropane-1-carboxylate deaminase/D-cysteine desulfhydrase-like pyridoxal-dependent ACC family enzyme
VIGVRCVDSVVCNRYRIAGLANATLSLLDVRSRISMRDVDLRDSGRVHYGIALESERNIISEVRSLSGIELDTTYTSKVFKFLKAEANVFRDSNVLYWNTFSPLGIKAVQAEAAL